LLVRTWTRKTEPVHKTNEVRTCRRVRVGATYERSELVS